LGTTLTNQNGLHKDIVRRGNTGWCRLHKEEFHALYPSWSIIRVIKSERINGRGLWKV